ncbi:MAG: flagellar protein export ATPase FliI [Candidatus Hydrogenedentota bacterium]|nr:MAG: flagellar protein export ATPase FliI [Candidatus Hydrogenedentota bacterium]
MGVTAFEQLLQKVDAAPSLAVHGKVIDVVGLTIEATGPPMKIGDMCYVKPGDDAPSIPVEVVGFRGDRILLMALGESHGIGPNSTLVPTHKPLMTKVGRHLIGRVLGGLGKPIDGGEPLRDGEEVRIMAPAPNAMDRKRILEPISTGIRAVDACITCGKGQRVGVMAGSGVGKSKLMGMVARNTNADINVIALIGERGREVKDFIEADLGDEGLSRSVVVVATSDEPALVRLKGAYLATAIAEWFRGQGLNVMLMMDSVTRFAMAQREVGLAIGEPPTTKGYPPSVFSVLPKLLERAGSTQEGSITGIYTVLVEADDFNDPISDAVRSILDGHIVLSRTLASKGHYPAIDVLESISRVMIDVTSDEHKRLAQQFRSVLSVFRDAEDLINIGAYVNGSNPEIDTAIRLTPGIVNFLKQGLQENSNIDDIEALMIQALG